MLLKQVVPAGTTVPVGELVGVIGQPGEDISGGAAVRRARQARRLPAGRGAGRGQPRPRSPPQPTAARRTAALPRPRPPSAAAGLKASPLARKWPRSAGSICGPSPAPGPRAASCCATSTTRPPTARCDGPSRRVRPSPPAASGAAYTDVPLTQIRKTIAKRLAQSIGPIPTFYLTTEVDMERAWEAREALNGAGAGGQGVVQRHHDQGDRRWRCRQHPACNAWWQDDRIRYWNEVHVSMAVAVEDGLITPVIRHADRKSLREISRRGEGPGRPGAGAEAQARGVHRRHLLGLEPRHVRHRPVHRDHQSARGRDPGRRAHRRSRPWCTRAQVAIRPPDAAHACPATTGSSTGPPGRSSCGH